MTYSRFAIFYLPDAELATFGASWLGWDIAQGQTAKQFDIPRLQDVTNGPRKYGFHATLKPPFALRSGQTLDGLMEAVSKLAAHLPAGQCAGLEPKALGRFIALVPSGDTAEIDRIAATCVRALDTFRAPLSETELARRQTPHLTAQQRMHLARWGYPYVMDTFRFHITLTARVPKPDVDHWLAQAAQSLPPLPAAYHLNTLALVGERDDGFFELIDRFDLSG